jgi:hypothetical protein
MDDKTLLELAAKAAGVDLVWNDAECPGYYSDWRGLPQWEYWNPLVSDGVALRLAVKLRINVYNPTDKGSSASFWIPEIDHVIYMNEKEDDAAATRRAIVRAAAEIGTAMP